MPGYRIPREPCLLSDDLHAWHFADVSTLRQGMLYGSLSSITTAACDISTEFTNQCRFIASRKLLIYCKFSMTASLTPWITNFLIPCKRILLQSHLSWSISSSPLIKTDIHYRINKNLHWAISWTRWIDITNSHSISLRFILVLSFYHCIYFSTTFYFFPRLKICTRLSSPALPWILRVIHFSRFFLPLMTTMIFDKAYKIRSSSLCSFLLRIFSQKIFICVLPVRCQDTNSHSRIKEETGFVVQYSGFLQQLD
jgi:hypothetical protein